MLDKNRLAAFEALLKIEKEDAFSNLAIGQAVREHRPDNEAFVRNLVYGVLENCIYLDYLLDGLIKSGIRKVKLRARILLRMGLYQIEFMDSVPDYAAVGETVALSRKKCPGLSSLVNGVLRSHLRSPEKRELPDRETDPASYLSVRYSYNRDITDLWLRRFGEKKAESLMAAGNTTPELSICANTLKISREALSGRLRTAGIRVSLPEINGIPSGQAEVLREHFLYAEGSGVLDTEAFHEGLFYVQDLSSARAVAALAPRPGEKVLDVCAAPGGKSVFASLMLKDRGEILSCDIYKHKLRLMEKTVERLGITSIRLKQQDASIFDPSLESFADAVIADVPCSGLGVIRRRPEIKLRITESRIRELSLLQYKILENASLYVGPQGRLLYSTCTISELENEEVVRKFLQENRGFSVLSERQILPDSDGSDGFYYCVLKRL